MKIKEKSIWGRLATFNVLGWNQSLPYSLCSLFWRVLLNQIVNILFLTWVYCIIYGVISDYAFRWYTIYFVLIMLVIGLVGCLFYATCYWINDYTGRKEEKEWEERYRDKPLKQPSVIFTYIQAKKAKICPMIEWE